MISPTFDPAILMLIIGGVAAVFLAIASKVFYVEVDPRIEAVEDALPGANCGGCGYTGCSACAEAMVAGLASTSVCVAGGADTWGKVAEAMGAEVSFMEPKVAKHYCNGGFRAVRIYEYDGALDCRIAAEFYGGDLLCSLGCLGLGTCVKECPFDALSMGKNGIPTVDLSKCVGCGACERVCPNEVIHLYTMSERLLHFNNTNECLAPCRQLCPAQIDIPAYIRLASEGKYEEALSVIRKRNPLPLTCGRICPAPCEEGCRRSSVEGDTPVHHNYIKRFMADWEMNRKVLPETPMLPDSGKKVAIVGGGPSGLSAAYFLRRLGHAVTIFEGLSKLGGMLRYGIPEYRLPKKVLDFEIQGIIDLGIEVKTDVMLGKDFTIQDLEEDYGAIYLAMGAWDNHSLRLEGEDEIEGVYKGTEFLSKRELGLPQDVMGKKVVVVGGGNTAIDAVRTSLRLEAEEITIMYRRTRKEMPANEVEIVAAEHEGIKFLFLAAPSRLISENGKLKQIEYIRMELGEPDASGRRRPVPIEGSETIIDADVIISAIGQRPKSDWMTEDLKEKGLKITRWNTIEADKATLQTDIPHIFTGGDIFSGPALVVDATGAGRQAARSIHLFLDGKDMAFPPGAFYRPRKLKESHEVQVERVNKKEKVPQPELEVEDRIHNFDEVDLVVDRELMLKEASRCLNCGTICFYSDEQAKKKEERENKSALEKLEEWLSESPY